MLRFITALIFAAFATAASAQAPVTTKPSLTDMLKANCDATRLIVGSPTSPTCTPAPTRAGDIFYYNGTNIVLLPGNNSGTQFLQETAAGVPSWATVAGTGTVTSVTPGGGLVSSTTANCSQTAVTTAGTLSRADCVNAQVGTTYAIVDGDRGKIITASNAAAQAYSIAQASTASNFFAGWTTFIENNSTNVAGVVTITPATSQICAQGACAATYKIQPGQFARITSDGTNYQVTENQTGSQVPGTITNDNACAGCVQEYKETLVLAGSAVSLSNGVTGTMGSLVLPAGDFEVQAVIYTANGGTTTFTFMEVALNGTAATLPTRAAVGTNGVGAGSNDFENYNGAAGLNQTLVTGMTRVSSAAGTTVFAVVNATFGVSTCAVYGVIRARRAR